jgi:hypothetical protein
MDRMLLPATKALLNSDIQDLSLNGSEKIWMLHDTARQAT